MTSQPVYVRRAVTLRGCPNQNIIKDSNFWHATKSIFTTFCCCLLFVSYNEALQSVSKDQQCDVTTIRLFSSVFLSYFSPHPWFLWRQRTDLLGHFVNLEIIRKIFGNFSKIWRNFWGQRVLVKKTFLSAPLIKYNVYFTYELYLIPDYLFVILILLGLKGI